MTPEWKLREIHETQFLHVCKELGFMDSQGYLRKWDGKKFFNKWKSLGHSTTEFKKCSCQLEKS